MATIIEQLKKIFNIKNSIKETINNMGGTCDNNFTKYKERLAKLIIERDASIGNYFSIFNIPSYVTKIGDYAFPNAKFEEITVPNTITTIGEKAFYNNRLLKKVTLPDTITLIGADSFNNCAELKEINLPNSIEYIGTGAFNNCRNWAI